MDNSALIMLYIYFLIGSVEGFQIENANYCFLLIWCEWLGMVQPMRKVEDMEEEASLLSYL